MRERWNLTAWPRKGMGRLRLKKAVRGGAPVVVGGRESRPQGEGEQSSVEGIWWMGVQRIMDVITKAQYALAKKAQARTRLSQKGILTVESRMMGNYHVRFGATAWRNPPAATLEMGAPGRSNLRNMTNSLGSDQEQPSTAALTPSNPKSGASMHYWRCVAQ